MELKSTPENQTYLPFFVYGTLLPGQPNHYLLAPFVIGIQPATIAGCRLYDFGNYPMLVPVNDADTAVTGKLITIAKRSFHDVLVSLDQLEGYHPHNPDSAYRRRQQLVHVDSRRETLAWTYLGRREFAQHIPPIPSGDWAAHVERQQLELQKWWQNIDTVADLLQKPPDEDPH